ncbi:hypothetical protein BWO91_06230 [Plantibacter flavus]|uniref:hypothetical protein n=1 Tax=Plantibacter flavus TaxID=150123 RepID=UPI00099D5C65|nr:hypothetical protein [Plantibacter flavus]AQX79638.1 hypothetical protein BWO91_06230 [Plantibacter flavus]
MSELAQGGILPGKPGDRIWGEPEGLETFVPFTDEQLARIRRNAQLVTFDSMGSPIYRHQLPPEGTQR